MPISRQARITRTAISPRLAMRIFLNMSSICQRRTAGARAAFEPLCLLFIGIRHAQNRRFIECLADDLHSDRQTVRSETTWNRDRGKTNDIEESREPCQRGGSFFGIGTPGLADVVDTRRRD